MRIQNKKQRICRVKYFSGQENCIIFYYGICCISTCRVQLRLTRTVCKKNFSFYKKRAFENQGLKSGEIQSMQVEEEMIYYLPK